MGSWHSFSFYKFKKVALNGFCLIKIITFMPSSKFYFQS